MTTRRTKLSQKMTILFYDFNFYKIKKGDARTIFIQESRLVV